MEYVGVKEMVTQRKRKQKYRIIVRLEAVNKERRGQVLASRVTKGRKQMEKSMFPHNKCEMTFLFDWQKRLQLLKPPHLPLYYFSSAKETVLCPKQI